MHRSSSAQHLCLLSDDFGVKCLRCIHSARVLTQCVQVHLGLPSCPLASEQSVQIAKEVVNGKYDVGYGPEPV